MEKTQMLFLKEFQSKLSLPKGNALAIAEGEGRNAVFLAGQGLNVTAWDYSNVGLEKTKQLAKEKGVKVKTELVDLNAAPWKGNEWDEVRVDVK
jgi:2-polyprenyl-3-methyl-5-hydroxy-6-metoxy-1,4-benzoquinol methylase